MKKIYCFILFLCTVLTGHAQITIQSADLPQPNDMIRVSTGAAFVGMDATLTGANYSWDYSMLSPLSQQIDTFLDINSTNPLYSIIFINISFNANRCNVANRGTSFSLGIASVNDVFNFYYNSSSAYTQKGFGAAVNGVPLPVLYSPFDVVYNLPIHFADEDSSASSYHVDLLSTLHFYYKVNKVRHNIVDGWGSVTTPYGTFDALRVKTTIIENDSAYLDTILHTGFNLPTVTTIEYKWLSTGQKVPVLQINTTGTGTVSQITYRDSVRSLVGINGIEASSGTLDVYPNPSSGDLFVRYQLKKSCLVSNELFSMNGKLVYEIPLEKKEAGKHEEKLSIQDLQLSPGTYLLRTSIDGQTGLKEVILGK